MAGKSTGKMSEPQNKGSLNTPQLQESEYIERVLTGRGYMILEELGVGTYTHVYKLMHTDGKWYAVKMFDLNKSPKALADYFLPREMHVIVELTHKNIVNVYEIIKAGPYIMVFTEYVQHGSLASLVKQNGRLSEADAKPMFAQIADALLYMHTLDVAHRNLKLENILLDKNNHPKLTDFSYATICGHSQEHSNQTPDEEEESTTFCGCLPYMPPEIIQELKYDPKKADIWSLGVCLFIALNLTYPFHFDNTTEMLESQLLKSYTFEPGVRVSDQLKDCLQRMLEPDAKKRLSATSFICHPWLKPK